MNNTAPSKAGPDLRSASDWSRRVGNLLQPIRSTTKIWEVTGNLEFHRSFLRHHFAGKLVVASQHVAWIVFSGYDYGRRLATVQVKVYITNQYKKQGSKVQSKSVLQLVLGVSCS